MCRWFTVRSEPVSLRQCDRTSMVQPVTDLAEAWKDLGVPLGRCLELAYRTLQGGGLACGSVITDASGIIIAEGRNRAYDPPGGDGILQGNPLAHAELNALAEIPTERDLGDCVLWSSQQPCSMCTAAARFVKVGGVRYLAVDPAFIGTEQSGAGAPLDQAAQVAPEWPLVANVLFLHNIIVKRGSDSEAVARNLEIEPETTGLAIEVVEAGAFNHDDLLTGLAPLWSRFVEAAASRTRRISRASRSAST
jgi:tRNA(Arg) A34 adenosine deaminase TadA